MDAQKLYEIFAEVLADDGIKAEIIRKFSEKAEKDHIEGQTELFPREDTSALLAENTEMSRRIALLELQVSQLSGENRSLSDNLRQCRDSMNFYCGAYGAQIALYEKYKTLSESTLKVTRQIFKNDSLNGFFICGTQLDNLRSLRDYTEKLIKENYPEKEKDTAVLNELYIYLLSCYNQTYSKPVYRLTEVRTGDEFDDRLHHNTGTGKSGKISQVLMQGCIAAGSGKIIRKAIISI